MAIDKIETDSLASGLVAPTATTATALTTASGSAPSYSARAWVNFNGTGTVAIRASGNVSSITDNGTGDYTVNFTTAMPDANYALAGTCERNYATENGTSLNQNSQTAATTSAVRVTTWRVTTGNVDPANVYVAIFR